MTGFRYLDHMTDVIVEAYGNTLEDAFANSARGLVNTMFELSEVSPDMEVAIYAEGHDLKSLLYNWLEKVMLIMLIDNILVSDSKIIISGCNGYVFDQRSRKGRTYRPREAPLQNRD